MTPTRALYRPPAPRQLGDGGLPLGRSPGPPPPTWGQRLGAAWRSGEGARRSVFAAPILAVAFSVLAFGGVYGWAFGIAYLLIFGALGVWCVQVLRGRWSWRWHWLYVPAMAFAGCIGWQYGSGNTVVAGSTLTASLHLAAAAALFLIVTQLYRPELDVNWLGMAFAVFTAALALLAILQILTGYNGIYWHFTYAYANPAGSFVNKNHFAGCMEMLLPVAAVEAYQRRQGGWLRQMPWVLGPGMGVVAVLLSASRGGALSLLSELLVAVALVLFLERRRLRRLRRLPTTSMNNLWLPIPQGRSLWTGAAGHGQRQRRRRAGGGGRRSGSGGGVSRGLVGLLAALALVLTLVLVAGTDRLQARWQNVRGYAPDTIQRGQLNLSSLAMWRQRPAMGWGLGTWADVYPGFARFTDEAVYEFAHNDYLQLLAETGWVGAGCVLAFWGIWLWQFGQRMRAWAPLGVSPPEVTVALAAALGCGGIFVHSWVDFNLHIPSNLLLFFTMTALALPEVRR